MPEIGTSGLMSGDGKRGDGLRPPSYRAILDSTGTDVGNIDQHANLRYLSQINQLLAGGGGDVAT